MQNSSSPLNTSKTHLDVGEFSLQTTWKQAESLLYNQGSKEGLHRTRQEKKRSCQVGTCTPRRRLRRKGRLHWWRSVLGSELFKSHVGVWHRNSSALGRWDSWWDSPEHCGKPGLWLWGAPAVFWQWVENPLNGCPYSLQSSPGTCSSLKRAKAPASFISRCTGTQDWGLPGPHTEEELSHERWRRLRLEAVSERSGGSCYWLLHRLQGRRSSELTAAGGPQPAPRHIERTPVGPPALWSDATPGWGWQRLKRKIGQEEQRRLSPEVASEQGRGSNC